MTNEVMNPIQQHSTTSTMMLDSRAVESYKDMAKLMAQAQVQVPDHLKGKPADCLAVVLQAAQWQMNPFVVAQKTHVINGTLGYEAQLVNAVVSSSNAINGRFKYEYQGSREDWKPKWSKEMRGNKEVWKPQFSANAAVRVGAVLTGESDITWGEWVYPCDQTIFNSPLWRTNPKQQAGYLAVKFWARFFTPDVLLGAYTPDELHEANQMRDINPEPAQQAKSKVMERLQSATKTQKSKTELRDEIDKRADDLSQRWHPDAEAIAGEWLEAVGQVETPEQLQQTLKDFTADKRSLGVYGARVFEALSLKKKHLEGNDE